MMAVKAEGARKRERADVRPAGAGPTRARCRCGGIPGPSGECAACRRKRRPALQAKLRLGRPRDRWEREADRVAQTVTRPGHAPETAPSVTPVGPGTATAPVQAPPEVAAAVSGPGRPLEADTRRRMEARFGRDFGSVRIHADGRADRAARSVGARAFTVGRDIAFAAGEYRPGTRGGRHLLAHELTHTLQQGGADGASPGGPGTVQRQPASPPAGGGSDPAFEATMAEATCDMKRLCELRTLHPSVVPERRVEEAARTCRPGVLWIGPSPCLEPAILNPTLFPPVTVPPSGTRTPATGPGTPPAPAPSTPDLGDMLTFEFQTGDVAYTVKLPSSAKARLPWEFRRGYKLTFQLEAKASGAFTFSVTLDGVPHVQFSASTTVDVAGKALKSELKVSSEAKTCHAMSPQATRDSLKKAGEKLEKAILQVNKSPEQVEAEKAAETTGAPVEASPPEGFDRVKRLADVVSGIVDVKKALDEAEKGCEPTPTVGFGISSQIPLDPSADDALPATVSGGLIINF